MILHPRVGGKATASVMAHAQVALVGLTLAFMAVHYLAEPLGSWWALAVGLGVSVAWSGMLMLVRRRMRDNPLSTDVAQSFAFASRAFSA